MKNILFTTTCWVLTMTVLAQSPIETVVFQNGQDGYNCYRIPAIVKTPAGDLLAFAEARKHTCSDHGDVRIVMKRSSDHGHTWSNLQVVAENANYQAGNPAPVFDLTDRQFPRGRLFLFYNTGTVSEQEVRQGKAIREVWYKTSTDGGLTWSSPVNITTQVNRPNHPATHASYTFAEDWRSYANTPGHALQIKKGRHKGRIFVAANHSSGAPKANYHDYTSHGFYTDNHGQSFQLSPSLTFASSNEATAAETSDGGLVMNCRIQSGEHKYRLQVVSQDAGQTWQEAKIMYDLPDPVCEGSIIDYQPKRGKKVLLFCNANSQTKREKLTIRISTDDGRTWSVGRELQTGAAAYSDLVIQHDRRIGVLYEKDNYSRIVYTKFGYEWIKGQ